MKRTGIAALFLGAAFISGFAFLAISHATLAPVLAQGVGPSAVHVTSSGWIALLTSMVGTGGFTIAGIITALSQRLGIRFTSGSQQAVVAEVIELTQSFAALMSDKQNRAIQRRFFFALVDAAKLMDGCETAHDGGVIMIKYSGYANPITATQPGANA